MRLADGATANEGRVEIFYRGQWGTVCDNLWDLTDASVVCRALGFENATQALGRAAFGQGSGPIMLDEVQCTGTEPSLAECTSLGWLHSNCRHERDAGVVCTNGAPKAGGVESQGAPVLTGDKQVAGAEPGLTVGEAQETPWGCRGFGGGRRVGGARGAVAAGQRLLWQGSCGEEQVGGSWGLRCEEAQGEPTWLKPHNYFKPIKTFVAKKELTGFSFELGFKRAQRSGEGAAH
ncbi:hypothetical protein P7K49_011952 [Saguinus oedipus]|uniref:SRCR domain-containing protein n=1 Tax=Saguinus oedipus TaxID=9490 RepID=A0ABQ9VS43_SAGOE|nr:hypothetical protein P7K49_011952 [Saguinus oedipus]